MARRRMHNLPEDVILRIIDYTMPTIDLESLEDLKSGNGFLGSFYSLMRINKHWYKTVKLHRYYTCATFENVNAMFSWLSNPSRRRRRIHFLCISPKEDREHTRFLRTLDLHFSDVVFENFRIKACRDQADYISIPLFLKARHLAIDGKGYPQHELDFEEFSSNDWLKAHLKTLVMTRITLCHVTKDRCFEALEKLILWRCEKVYKFISNHPTITTLEVGLLEDLAISEGEEVVVPPLHHLSVETLAIANSDFIVPHFTGLKSLEVKVCDMEHFTKFHHLPDNLESLVLRMDECDVGAGVPRDDELFEWHIGGLDEEDCFRVFRSLRTFTVNGCNCPLFIRLFNAGFSDFLFPKLEYLDLRVVGEKNLLYQLVTDEKEKLISYKSFIRFKNCDPNCKVSWTVNGRLHGEKMELL